MAVLGATRRSGCRVLHGVRSSTGGQPRPSAALPPAILPFDCAVITVSMQSEKAAFGW